MRAGGVVVGVLVVGMIGVASCSSNNEQTDGGAPSGGNDAHFDIAVDGARPRPGTVRMAVPAYFPPSDAQWQRLISAAPTVGMIVFNPDSGRARPRTPPTQR